MMAQVPGQVQGRVAPPVFGTKIEQTREGARQLGRVEKHGIVERRAPVAVAPAVPVRAKADGTACHGTGHPRVARERGKVHSCDPATWTVGPGIAKTHLQHVQELLGLRAASDYLKVNLHGPDPEARVHRAALPELVCGATVKGLCELQSEGLPVCRHILSRALATQGVWPSIPPSILAPKIVLAPSLQRCLAVREDDVRCLLE
mmetsp:Transcript_53776/g.153236  ORF Transcript_53776/g.153236 Transcript_53776/m.153236 type:complete len:204 (-) Transcript_53776:625-1236(-)